MLSLSSILSEGSDSVLNSVLWFTQHVHCLCKRCDGMARSRKVEFDHWKRSQLLGSNLCWKNVNQSNMQTNSISATDQSSKISDYSDEDQRGENPKG